MSSNNLSTGAWANIGTDCPLSFSVSGSDMANIVIGGEGHSIELIFSTAGLRSLVKASRSALAELNACFEAEDAALEVTDRHASPRSQAPSS